MMAHITESTVWVAWAKSSETKWGMDATDPLLCCDCMIRLASVTACGSPMARSGAGAPLAGTGARQAGQHLLQRRLVGADEGRRLRHCLDGAEQALQRAAHGCREVAAQHERGMEVADLVQRRGEDRAVDRVEPRRVDGRPEDLALTKFLVGEVLGSLGDVG